ncbi:succinate dehydrogenase cytochrome b subunit [Pleurocapsales cyanobacterium LEGE 06147]|nr:succinate dehydrogenase cytochrome b subunit [Pleurocapsales cyanobacterium LEGE 06147]
MTFSSNNSNLLNFYSSPIGKKIITGVTGLGLTVFVLLHMIGNLVLFASPEAYNQLAYFLNSLGILLYGFEFILLGLVIFHVAIAIAIQFNKQQARPIDYNQFKSAGKPSKQTISSRTMIVTGLVLLVFLAIHLQSFKFGTYYPTIIKGVEMRDLARLVIEKFHNPVYAFGYTGVMVLLGLHLRHGIWSAFQSLGAMNARLSSVIYALGFVFAVAIALGFLILPLAIYFGM